MSQRQNAKKLPKLKPGTISGSVDARALTARLRTLARHADIAGPRIPILNCVTIELDQFYMRVSHFGLDKAMTATIPATGSGSTCVPLKTLLAFMSGADGDVVTIAKGDSDDVVTFTCGAWRSEIVPNNIEDAPQISLPGEPVRSFAMSEGVFKHAVAFVMPMVSTEETRYYLNGVCFEVDDDRFRVVATDGHRLAVREGATPAPLKKWDAKPILPRGTVSALLDIIGPAQCFAHFHAWPEDMKNKHAGFPSHAVFTREGWTVVSKLIDGTYPDWRRVIPKVLGDAVATVDAKPFERLATIARGAGAHGSISTRAVRITDADGHGFSLQIHSPGEVKLSGSAPGEASAPFEPFGVNLYYLASIAKAFGSKKLKLAIKGPGDPITITTPESPTGEFAVLMPMRV
ncbi:DNA polymerase III subunit beta [Neorhizobium sp. T786]|uniref:DNA polymerase III subunit beta n=1 Tax=Pseudorhizobium xiangyangii TaxID=2883104 RepID=UPI001CFF87A1|nr:DNA polymerase III subunit beta [Neorhizobium xiangyangii]MCB5201664.1 DNA polymerase III subunit beta [Neorhizobium xiangyangii]